MQDIILNFIAEDFSGDYIDSDNCAVGRATKRELGWGRPVIGRGYAYDHMKKHVGYCPQDTIVNGRPLILDQNLDTRFSAIEYFHIIDLIEKGEFVSASVTLKQVQG